MSELKDDTSFTRFNYKLVSVGLGTNSIILIDVRDISKRLIFGRIPGSLHVPLKEIAIAFNTSAATSKEFEGEYDFKRPPKKEKDRKKTIVLVSDCVIYSTVSQTKLEDDDKFENQETSDITIEEEEDVNENSLPFLNTPVPDAALHAASILKELGYENIAIYPGGVSDWRNNGGKVFVDADDNKKLVDFWDVRHGRADDSMLIIDVRNPKERILPGAIKKTVNIPLCDIWPAFQLDNTKFQTKYGIEKHLLKTKKIVLHCLKGKRAFDAADKLALLGYDDVYVYKGSLNDWTTRRGSIVPEFGRNMTIRNHSKSLANALTDKN